VVGREKGVMPSVVEPRSGGKEKRGGGRRFVFDEKAIGVGGGEGGFECFSRRPLKPKER